MTTRIQRPDGRPRYVFIAYVRDDLHRVEVLARGLERRGVRIWMDKEDIEPGDRWKLRIDRAIEAGAFFIACFSQAFNSREHSYMYREIRKAIEELACRPNDRAWFIPVGLGLETIPDLPIPGGETLRDIQAVFLPEEPGPDWERQLDRLARRLLEPPHTLPSQPASTSQPGPSSTIQPAARGRGGWLLALWAVAVAAVVLAEGAVWLTLPNGSVQRQQTASDRSESAPPSVQVNAPQLVKDRQMRPPSSPTHRSSGPRRQRPTAPPASAVSDSQAPDGTISTNPSPPTTEGLDGVPLTAEDVPSPTSEVSSPRVDRYDVTLLRQRTLKMASTELGSGRYVEAIVEANKLLGVLPDDAEALDIKTRALGACAKQGLTCPR